MKSAASALSLLLSVLLCSSSPAKILVVPVDGSSVVVTPPTPRPPQSTQKNESIVVQSNIRPPIMESLAKNNSVVMICYTHDPMIKQQCKAQKEKFLQCGIRPILLENKSIADVRKGVKGLPPNTNVFIAGHGINWAGNSPVATAASVLGAGSSPLGGIVGAERLMTLTADTHYIGVPKPLGEDMEAKWNARFEIPLEGRVIKTNLMKSADLFKALDEELGKDGLLPAKIFGACFGGNVITDDSFRNIMTVASWNQFAQGHEDIGFMSDLEHETTNLLCNPGAFSALSKEGRLGGNELASHFKRKGLPRFEEIRETPVLKDFVLYPVTKDASTADRSLSNTSREVHAREGRK